MPGSHCSISKAPFDNPSYECPERPFVPKEKREPGPKKAAGPNAKPKIRAKAKVKQEKSSPKGKPAKGSGKRKRG